MLSSGHKNAPDIAPRLLGSTHCLGAAGIGKCDLVRKPQLTTGKSHSENAFVQMKRTVLAFLDDVYEDLELWYPKLRLEEAGYALKCAAPEIKTFTGKHGYPAHADLLLKEARSEDFCGLLVPGGFMPDKLRRDAKVLSLTQEFYEAGKLVAFICHGGWIPISAKILKGKRVTGSLGIKDDLENAGGIWVDEPAVEDGNLISSRTPRDLAAFSRALVRFLETHVK